MQIIGLFVERKVEFRKKHRSGFEEPSKFVFLLESLFGMNFIIFALLLVSLGASEGVSGCAGSVRASHEILKFSMI